MASNGVTEIDEIGAGKALIGMVRRIDKEIATGNAGTADEAKALAAAIKG